MCTQPDPPGDDYWAEQVHEAGAANVRPELKADVIDALLDIRNAVESVKNTPCPYCGSNGGVFVHQDIVICKACNRRRA